MTSLKNFLRQIFGGAEGEQAPADVLIEDEITDVEALAPPIEEPLAPEPRFCLSLIHI